jgi:hypothetical protein
MPFQGSSAETLSVREGVPDLLSTLDFVAVQIEEMCCSTFGITDSKLLCRVANVIALRARR